jgi:hypothetical protein
MGAAASSNSVHEELGTYLRLPQNTPNQNVQLESQNIVYYTGMDNSKSTQNNILLNLIHMHLLQPKSPPALS